LRVTPLHGGVLVGAAIALAARHNWETRCDRTGLS
jgi:hypothetical protein